PVTVQITVNNQGTAPAGAFIVTVTDGAGGTGPRLATLPVTGIAAGANKVVLFANWTPAQGKHVLTVNVDAARNVPDSNLGNNVAEVFLTVGQAAKPDLAV